MSFLTFLKMKILVFAVLRLIPGQSLLVNSNFYRSSMVAFLFVTLKALNRNFYRPGSFVKFNDRIGQFPIPILAENPVSSCPMSIV